MRRPSSFHDRSLSMELKMTSLIDVVFLLLIFFVWTASFRIAEYTLPSSISESAAAGASASAAEPPPPEADFPEVVVRVSNAAGQLAWRVNEEPVGSLQDVRAKLAQVFQIYREAPVIIHPEASVALGDVIDLYDVTRVVGFAKVQFAASQGL